MKRWKLGLMVVCLLAAVICLSGCSSYCNHSFGAWKIKRAATCTETGLRVRKCSKCKMPLEQILDTLDHAFSEWGVVTAPTCNAPGVEARTCSGCGAKEENALAQLKHKFGDWSVSQASTCIAEGKESRVCSGCGAKEERPLGTLANHDWQGDCQTLRSCKVCGTTDGQMGAHTYVDGKCTGCNAKEQTEPATGNQISLADLQGVWKYSGKNYTETVTISGYSISWREDYPSWNYYILGEGMFSMKKSGSECMLDISFDNRACYYTDGSIYTTGLEMERWISEWSNKYLKIGNAYFYKQ